jgi:P-type conjugative transfer protein TrbL
VNHGRRRRHRQFPRGLHLLHRQRLRLLGGEVAFIATTLIVIDVTLAALFWSWGADDDIIARLVKKTLFVGVFAYLIGNWNNLAKIVFDSFAGPRPQGFRHQLHRAGSDATRQGRADRPRRRAPLLESISDLMGWIAFFENFIQIACLLFAWALVLLAFFILAIQLFVTLIEFKLTTLAGFVLIPFGLFGKTAFMAERVLGNVVSSGIKVLVLAVIIGIGSTLFSQFTAGFGGDAHHRRRHGDRACRAVAARLGIFGPGIAAGLVSGGPQLGAGAAVGTGLAVGGAARSWWRGRPCHEGRSGCGVRRCCRRARRCGCRRGRRRRLQPRLARPVRRSRRRLRSRRCRPRGRSGHRVTAETRAARAPKASSPASPKARRPASARRAAPRPWARYPVQAPQAKPPQRPATVRPTGPSA